MSLVVEMKASGPGSLEYESRMRQRKCSFAGKLTRIGAVKAFDPR